jgi:hypothetical protein
MAKDIPVLEQQKQGLSAGYGLILQPFLPAGAVLSFDWVDEFARLLDMSPEDRALYIAHCKACLCKVIEKTFAAAAA